MKIFDRVAVILINLSLIAVFIITPALIAASSPSYYERQFEKNGIYSHIDKNGEKKRTIIYNICEDPNLRAEFSDEQLNVLIAHIIDFLFGDTKSFELKMDGVMLNGKLTDGVSVFGETAVLHMDDVKSLMAVAKWAAIALGLLLIGLIAYTAVRRKEIGKIALKYTLIFYAALLVFISAFLIATLISYFDWIKVDPQLYLDALWRNVHHLLFPFQPKKFESSFFNDTLTEILTLELFLDAMIIVFATLFSALALWLGYVFWMRRSAKRGESK